MAIAREELERIGPRIATADRDKVDAHVAALDSLEQRLRDKATPVRGADADREGRRGRHREYAGRRRRADRADRGLVRVRPDARSRAFSTRYGETDNHPYPFLGISDGHHNLTHARRQRHRGLGQGREDPPVVRREVRASCSIASTRSPKVTAPCSTTASSSGAASSASATRTRSSRRRSWWPAARAARSRPAATSSSTSHRSQPPARQPLPRDGPHGHRHVRQHRHGPRPPSRPIARLTRASREPQAVRVGADDRAREAILDQRRDAGEQPLPSGRLEHEDGRPGLHAGGGTRRCGTSVRR